MSNPRAGKLADQIREITASMLERRIKDPRLGFVTVTDVRLTGDSREATIFYTVYGSESERASTAAALKSATGLIRSTIGKQLGLKFTPTITFVPDAVPETAAQIAELLERAHQVDAEVAAQAAGKQFAGDPDPYKHDDEFDDDSDEDDEPRQPDAR